MFRVLRCYLALWIIATTFAVETMAQSPPRKLAFLVGVSRYQKEGLRNLRYAEDDIRELALELRKLGFKTYGVLGAKAT
ncbi:MAG: hypothetical protein KDA71_18325, partial [Planctomycetales bacterium]|nr:hypothetical protein [Planctomycetales bacterium]